MQVAINDLSSLKYLENLNTGLQFGDAYVDFSGFTKKQVITALYNSAEHRGLGRLSNDQIPLSEQDILDGLHNDWIDYLKGKPLKLKLKKFPFVLSREYDRDSPIKMKDVLRKMRKGTIDFVKE